MAVKEIPVRSDVPSYEFQIELDEVTYTLRFTYNGRIDRWFMDIFDNLRNPIRTGIKLLTSWRVTRQYVADGLPPGDFVVLDTGNEDEIAKNDDFGIRKIMTYLEEGTL